jgi:2-oxoglutarate dehydrogenase E1 component
MDESLFEGQNAAYVQAMFEEYARNPEAVPSEWRKLFEEKTSATTLEAPSVPDPPSHGTGAISTPSPVRVTASSEADEHLRRVLPVVSRATALVQAFRDHGHQLARIDPLGTEPPGHPQLLHRRTKECW